MAVSANEVVESTVAVPNTDTRDDQTISVTVSWIYMGAAAMASQFEVLGLKGKEVLRLAPFNISTGGDYELITPDGLGGYSNVAGSLNTELKIIIKGQTGPLLFSSVMVRRKFGSPSQSYRDGDLQGVAAQLDDLTRQVQNLKAQMATAIKLKDGLNETTLLNADGDYYIRVLNRTNPVTGQHEPKAELSTDFVLGPNNTIDLESEVEGTLPVAHGGTGGKTAAEARAALGVTDGFPPGGKVGQVVKKTATGKDWDDVHRFRENEVDGYVESGSGATLGGQIFLADSAGNEVQTNGNNGSTIVTIKINKTIGAVQSYVVTGEGATKTLVAGNFVVNNGYILLDAVTSGVNAHWLFNITGAITDESTHFSMPVSLVQGVGTTDGSGIDFRIDIFDIPWLPSTQTPTNVAVLSDTGTHPWRIEDALKYFRGHFNPSFIKAIFVGPEYTRSLKSYSSNADGEVFISSNDPETFGAVNFLSIDRANTSGTVEFEAADFGPGDFVLMEVGNTGRFIYFEVAGAETPEADTAVVNLWFKSPINSDGLNQYLQFPSSDNDTTCTIFVARDLVENAKDLIQGEANVAPTGVVVPDPASGSNKLVLWPIGDLRFHILGPDQQALKVGDFTKQSALPNAAGLIRVDPQGSTYIVNVTWSSADQRAHLQNFFSSGARIKIGTWIATITDSPVNDNAVSAGGFGFTVKTISGSVPANGSVTLYVLGRVVHWGDTGALFVPTGGTTGQIIKKTATGYEWANDTGGFDIHDDVSTAQIEANISADDRFILSAEDLAGDPMQYTTLGVIYRHMARVAPSQTTLSDADEIIFNDVSALTARKITFANLKTAVGREIKRAEILSSIKSAATGKTSIQIGYKVGLNLTPNTGNLLQGQSVLDFTTTPRQLTLFKSQVTFPSGITNAYDEDCIGLMWHFDIWHTQSFSATSTPWKFSRFQPLQKSNAASGGMGAPGGETFSVMLNNYTQSLPAHFLINDKSEANDSTYTRFGFFWMPSVSSVTGQTGNVHQTRIGAVYLNNIELYYYG